MSKLLKQECILHVLGNYGISPKFWGIGGVTSSNLINQKKIIIEVENKKQEHLIYAAKAKIDKDLRALCCIINDEYFLIFRMEKFPIHGFRSSFDEKNGLFLFFEENKKREPSLYEYLIVCAGTEKLANSGISWEPWNDFDDLYKVLVELVEI